ALLAHKRYRARRLRVGSARIDFERWKFLQSWFHRVIGRNMLNLRQSAEPRFRRTMSRKSNRRIFCVDPAKQRAALFRCRSDQSDTGRGREKRDRRRINHLENKKTK